MLEKYWPVIGDTLSNAKSESDVVAAISKIDENARTYFDPFPDLADSLGGRGQVSPRRSRDTCAKDRKTVRHKIYRQRFLYRAHVRI